MPLVFIFIALATCAGLVTLYQAVRISRLAAAGRLLANSARPFSRTVANAGQTIAIVGDSTAYGTGAATPQTSVAGLIAAAYPTCNLINVSKNGARIADVLTRFDLHPLGHPDAVLMLIGGNDVLHRTPSASIERDLPALIKKISAQTNGLILMMPGNFRTAPIFPWPVNAYFQRQSVRVRSIIKRVAQRQHVPFIDIYRPRASDPFTDARYYAADGFHPSSTGYAEWFSHIKPVLDRQVHRARSQA